MTKTDQYPNARHLAEIVFPKTDYRGALEHFELSKTWCFDQNLIFNNWVTGIIHSPTYEGKEVPGGIIPDKWDTEAKEWQVTVDLYCHKTDPTDWIANLDITPPSGAELIRTP